MDSDTDSDIEEIIPENEQEYEERREDLIQQAKETREEAEAEQEAMLDAVAEGEDFQIEDYEWVELGNVDVKVKTWFPGESLEGASLAEDESSSVKERIMAMIDVLVEQTEVIDGPDAYFEERARIRSFYRKYFQRYGDQGLLEAIDIVAGPAEDNSKEHEVVKSFRGEGHGGPNRSRSHRR